MVGGHGEDASKGTKGQSEDDLSSGDAMKSQERRSNDHVGPSWSAGRWPPRAVWKAEPGARCQGLAMSQAASGSISFLITAFLTELPVVLLLASTRGTS